MGTQSHESLDHELFILVEEFAALTAKNIDILLSKFESHRFKIEVTWTIWEHESEVNVYHVASWVEKNVSIVTIFDL